MAEKSLSYDTSFDGRHEKIMVRFNKKESEARKELLASMNQVNDAKESENGKRRWDSRDS